MTASLCLLQPPITTWNMAPKDPLLATLKVCILNLQSDGETVTDSSPHLISCCELLELILRKGLQQPVLSLVHRDFWQCFEQLPQQDTCGSLISLALAVDQTKACRKLSTSQGRGRYLLRLALKRKLLHQFITHLLHTNRTLEWYSPGLSILRNEEFVEPFMSLLMVLSQMKFKLDMENCSFLDESWLLPVCEVYEVVPCRELGMVLRYLNGRVFVLDLLPGSQAQVDKVICPGDVIDEINGISLQHSRNGQAGVVLSRVKGNPLSIRILRWRTQDGAVYRPLIKLLRALREENPSLQLHLSHAKQLARNDAQPPPSQCLKEGSAPLHLATGITAQPPLVDSAYHRIVYIVQFLGKVNVGMFGGKEVLQYAIPQVLKKNLPIKEVLLDMKETHLICTEKGNQMELLKHHYPEISCVGRYGQPDRTIFAFCLADSPETPQATGFCCVALKAGSVQECDEIVSRIVGCVSPQQNTAVQDMLAYCRSEGVDVDQKNLEAVWKV